MDTYGNMSTKKPEQLICASGSFPFVSCFDFELSQEIIRLPLVPPERLLTGGPSLRGHFYRIVRVMYAEDPSLRIVAVSGNERPSSPILCCNVDTEKVLVRLSGHPNAIAGLACVSSTSFSNPLIVSGSSRSHVLVHDASTGKELAMTTENAPVDTYRILHVPEWNAENVYFAGVGIHHRGGGGGGSNTAPALAGCLHCLDLETLANIGPEFKGASSHGAVCGLSADISRRLLFTGSGVGRELRIWSQQDHSQIGKPVPLNRDVRSSLFVEDQNLLLLGEEGGYVEMLDVRKLGESLSVSNVFTDGVDEKRQQQQENKEELRVTESYIYELQQLDQPDLFVAGSYSGHLSVFRVKGEKAQKLREKFAVEADNQHILGVAVFGNDDRMATDARREMEERVGFLMECFGFLMARVSLVHLDILMPRSFFLLLH